MKLNADLIIFNLNSLLGSIHWKNDLVLSAGRANFFRSLATSNKQPKLAIISNTGAGLHYWLKSGNFGEPEKYPSVEQATARAEAVATMINDLCYAPALYLCHAHLSRKGSWSPTPPEVENNPSWSHQWYLPAPGMLHQAIADAKAKPEYTLVIGHLEDIEEAADAANCQYVEDEEFFFTFKDVVTFKYRSSFVYGWLEDEERIGLDIFGTLARFEAVVKEQFLRWIETGPIVFQRADDDEDIIDFTIEQGDQIAHRGLYNQIYDLAINRHWLKYESAEAHAKALCWTKNQNIQVTLTIELREAYGLSYDEAQATLEQAEEFRRKNK